MVRPVLVTVCPPRTANVAADPRSIVDSLGSCAVARFGVKQRANAAAPRRNALTLFIIFTFTDPHFTSLCFFKLKPLFQFALQQEFGFSSASD
jgi:hypothetical protein